MTGADTEVISDETGTYICMGDCETSRVRIGDPELGAAMGASGGAGGMTVKVEGEIVVTPEGTFFKPADPEKEPVKIGQKAPTHAVLSKEQTQQLEEQYKENLEEARVAKLSFPLHGLKWDWLQEDPSLMVNMVNVVEEEMEKQVGGDVSAYLKPAVPAAPAAAPAPAPALIQLLRKDGRLIQLRKDGVDVIAECFVTGAQDWEAVGDVGIDPPGIMASIVKAAIVAALPPELASQVRLGGLKVFSTDPEGPGGLPPAEESSSLQKMYMYSVSEHINWNLVEKHREAKKEDEKKLANIEQTKMLCDDNVWADNDGRTCKEYEANLWCSWGKVVNGHKVRAHQNLYSAMDMCCSCGGGHIRNPLIKNPFNINAVLPVPITFEYKVVDFPLPSDAKGEPTSAETNAQASGPATPESQTGVQFGLDVAGALGGPAAPPKPAPKTPGKPEPAPTDSFAGSSDLRGKPQPALEAADAGKPAAAPGAGDAAPAAPAAPGAADAAPAAPAAPNDVGKPAAAPGAGA